MGKADKVLMLSVSVAMAVFFPHVCQMGQSYVYSLTPLDVARTLRGIGKTSGGTMLPRLVPFGSELCPASWRRDGQGHRFADTQ
jgi:hypothetical protein